MSNSNRRRLTAIHRRPSFEIWHLKLIQRFGGDKMEVRWSKMAPKVSQTAAKCSKNLAGWIAWNRLASRTRFGTFLGNPWRPNGPFWLPFGSLFSPFGSLARRWAPFKTEQKPSSTIRAPLGALAESHEICSQPASASSSQHLPASASISP